MRKLLLLTFIFSAYFITEAQTDSQYSKKKYFISMYNLHEKNYDFTKSLLEKFTEATSIEFNKVDSVFTLYTFRTLNKTSVSAKMLKNYVPIKYFILEGEPIDPFPTIVNTGNPEEDGKLYDQQKSVWIQKYPYEYKKMVESLKKQ
jgi:ABC-type glycerol-3-phosphate transport system substrate-binding protein